MCTVTYFPIEKGYILTHNRDEQPLRSPKSLTIIKHQTNTIIFPKDQQSNGTWIFINSKGWSACLLNGAFENHKKQSSYRMSRGQILLSLAQSKNINEWLNAQCLEKIEPFTLILCSGNDLMELIWDGAHKHIRSLDIEIPMIWSSATLYTPKVKEERKHIFYQWIENIKDFDPVAWMNKFHAVGSIGDHKNNIHMFRQDGPRTISTTQIVSFNGISKLIYHDVLNDHISEARLIQNRQFSENSVAFNAQL